MNDMSTKYVYTTFWEFEINIKRNTKEHQKISVKLLYLKLNIKYLHLALN